MSVYARMWPREVFDVLETNGGRKQPIVEGLQIFDKPGVYILYRDDLPYYVGQAERLRRRIRRHATKPEGRYYNFWNLFSAFVVESQAARNEIEGILIVSMPTANSAKPKFKKENFPKDATQMIRKIRSFHANQHNGH